jgi:hypothetical protein
MMILQSDWGRDADRRVKMILEPRDTLDIALQGGPGRAEDDYGRCVGQR